MMRGTEAPSPIDIIPYFFFAPEEADFEGARVSFLIEPRMIFRVNLENGSLQSARFKVGSTIRAEDLRIESDPVIVVNSSGEAAVFDAETFIPRLNGLSHKDISMALKTAKNHLLRAVRGVPARLDRGTVQMIAAKCQDQLQSSAAPLDPSDVPIEFLAQLQKFNVPAPARAASVFDDETRSKIEKAWIEGLFTDPVILEELPSLKLQLLFPWRTD